MRPEHWANGWMLWVDNCRCLNKFEGQLSPNQALVCIGQAAANSQQRPPNPTTTWNSNRNAGHDSNNILNERPFSNLPVLESHEKY